MLNTILERMHSYNLDVDLYQRRMSAIYARLKEILVVFSQSDNIVIVSFACGEAVEIAAIDSLMQDKFPQKTWRYIGLDINIQQIANNKVIHQGFNNIEFHTIDLSQTEQVIQILQDQQINLLMIRHANVGIHMSAWWEITTKTIPKLLESCQPALFASFITTEEANTFLAFLATVTDQTLRLREKTDCKVNGDEQCATMLGGGQDYYSDRYYLLLNNLSRSDNKHDLYNVKVNDKGETLLHYACHTGCYQMAMYLLQINPKHINYLTNQGKTPLHYAALSPDKRVLAALLTTDNVDINASDEVDSYTPLIIAITEHYNDNVKLLLQSDDIEINKTTLGDLSALYVAVISNNDEAVVLLLDRPDLDINYADYDGDTIFHRLVKDGHEEYLLNLLNKITVSQSACDNVDFFKQDGLHLSFIDYVVSTLVRFRNNGISSRMTKILAIIIVIIRNKIKRLKNSVSVNHDMKAVNPTNFIQLDKLSREADRLTLTLDSYNLPYNIETGEEEESVLASITEVITTDDTEINQQQDIERRSS